MPTGDGQEHDQEGDQNWYGNDQQKVRRTDKQPGAPGIFQALVRLLNGPPFEAVHAPRLHCTPDGLVQIEAERFSPASLDALETAGFTLQKLDAYSFSMGGLQLLVRENGLWHGVGEPRRDAAAVGP